MFYRGLLLILLFDAASVLGDVLVCNKTFSVLPWKLSKQLGADLLSESLKLVNTSLIEECAESCCQWDKCNAAVLTSGSCFNVLNHT